MVGTNRSKTDKTKHPFSFYPAKSFTFILRHLFDNSFKQ